MQNGFWALRDTKTPARIAVTRVVVSTAVAVPAMFALDRLTLVVADPTDVLMIDELEMQLGSPVRVSVGTHSAISGVLKKSESSQRVLDDPARIEPLLARAAALGVSDLFVQVYRGGRAWFDSAPRHPMTRGRRRGSAC